MLSSSGQMKGWLQEGKPDQRCENQKFDEHTPACVLSPADCVQPVPHIGGAGGKILLHALGIIGNFLPAEDVLRQAFLAARWSPLNPAGRADPSYSSSSRGLVDIRIPGGREKITRQQADRTTEHVTEIP